MKREDRCKITVSIQEVHRKSNSLWLRVGVEMKRSSDHGKTHRPRSVSSLLILLRAMLRDNVSGTRRCDARVRCEDDVEGTQ